MFRQSDEFAAIKNLSKDYQIRGRWPGRARVGGQVGLANLYD